jgi:hypothetical protein
LNNLKKRLTYLILLLLIFGKLSVNAQNFTEYEVKAAYIFNFSKFIKWPPSSFDNQASPYVLGIYGDDPFGNIIKKIIGNRKSNGRNWVVKYYSRPDQIKQCHILFISDVQPSELRKIFEHTSKMPILTVGDEIKDFCQQGGEINFTPKNSNKRFEINNKEANKAGLSISSKLLMLSKIISTDEVKF